MLFGGLALQGLAAADQQAEVGAALDQAEELIRRAQRVGNAQFAALVGAPQQLFHAVQHALRTCFVEHPRELGVLRRQAHHHPMQLHRLAAVDQLIEAPADIQQQLCHRHFVVQLEQQFGQLLLAFGLHRGGKQLLLVGEMAVHRELGNPGFRGNCIHAATVITITEEQGLRRFQNGFALGQVFGAAGAAGWQHFVWHWSFLILD